MFPIPGTDKTSVLSLKRTDRLQHPPGHLFRSTGHSFPWGPIGRNVKLTTHLLVPRLRMSGVVALPPRPAFLHVVTRHSFTLFQPIVFATCCAQSGPHCVAVCVGLCPPGDNCAVQILIAIFTKSFQFPAAHRHRHPFCSSSLSLYRGRTELDGGNTFVTIFGLTAFETAKHNQLICSVPKYVV